MSCYRFRRVFLFFFVVFVIFDYFAIRNNKKKKKYIFTLGFIESPVLLTYPVIVLVGEFIFILCSRFKIVSIFRDRQSIITKKLSLIRTFYGPKRRGRGTPDSVFAETAVAVATGQRETRELLFIWVRSKVCGCETDWLIEYCRQHLPIFAYNKVDTGRINKTEF